MKTKLILYPTKNISKMDKIIFFNQLIKQRTEPEFFKHLDFKINKPYGLETNLIKKNFSQMSRVHRKFLKLLTTKLNKFHSIDRGERYWSIVFGAWLRDFIWTTYNRYKSLKEVFESSEIDEIISVDDNEHNHLSEEIFDFMSHTNDLLFDAILINKIIAQTKFKNILKKNIPTDKYSFKKYNSKKYEKVFSIKKKLLNIFKLLRILKKNDDAFIINSGLPLIEEIKLQVYLKQIPQYWDIPKIKYLSNRNKFRDDMNLKVDSDDEFENILTKLIPAYIPLSIIEHYKDTINYCKNISWPQKPKFIFTSNSFGSSGIFQIWLAEKVHSGFKYFVGQHGFGYLELNEKKDHIEFDTADRFFSWGNKIFDKKILPLFNLSVVGKKKSYQIGEKLVIVTRSAGVRAVHYDRFEYGKILNLKTISLLENLNEIIKKKTTLRLHENYRPGIYQELDNFLENNSVFKIDQNTKYFSLINKSKLIVFNDISSGFLNNLSIDCPSICFLPIGLDFIHEENKKDYNELINNNLMFEDEGELAKFINKNWNDLDKWWSDTKVKKIRHEFCLKYSIPPPKNALKVFSNLLRNEISK